MDSGPLHQLHNARKEYILPVTDRIHLHFLSDDILIDKDRPFRIHRFRLFQIPAKHSFVRRDLHRPSSQDKAGPYQDRISDPGSLPEPFRNTAHNGALRVGDAGFLQYLLERIPVLCREDRFRGRSDDPDSSL